MKIHPEKSTVARGFFFVLPISLLLWAAIIAGLVHLWRS